MTSEPIPELTILAEYCVAPDDAILGAPDEERWACARLLDGLAVLSHGSRTPVAAVARSTLPTGGDVLAWPDPGPLRADDAAFQLGVSAFAENYADTGLGSVAHVNSIVVPALLLAAQRRPLSGRAALAALVVGYNVMEWVGGTLNGGRPRMAHQLRGFRPTPSAGPLAAVAVLARVTGCSVAETANALALACSQGGGLRPSTASPTSAIRIQSGEALRRAVHTLDLARAGIVAHPDMLRCPGGFFPAYAFSEPGPYPIPVAGEPGDLMTRVSMKLECTPHTLVTMLDAARAMPDHPGEVESVTVRVPAQHNVISGGDKAYPTTFAEAVGHVPYCIALAMCTGSHLFPQVISDGLADAAVRELTGRVRLVVEDRLTALFDDDPASWPAVVEVRWADGTADVVEMKAPETTQWTADEALEHAALKAVALLGVGTVGGLVAEFAGVPGWPDLWTAVRGHALGGAA
ncbi:hypothetical protein GCM10009836_71630 [Pseudonocardia ailaonensis]|uniref:2-methylcitrate dehydratase PrpD n=1 Tax=Pseudonocardia ailaonensis TaxID=367279 RepID=A0ABN2NPB8_9PSEU